MGFCINKARAAGGTFSMTAAERLAVRFTGRERADIYHLKTKAFSKQEQVAGAMKALDSP